MDEVPVDKSAVSAAEVFDRDATSVKGKSAMPPAYQLVFEANIGVLPAPENNSSPFERNLRKLILRIQDYQMRMHHHLVELDGIVVAHDGFVFHNFSVTSGSVFLYRKSKYM